MHFFPVIGIEPCRNGFIISTRKSDDYPVIPEYVARNVAELNDILSELLAIEKKRALDWAREFEVKIPE